MSLPGLFPPVRIDDKWLVDGGLVNPVPVTACRALGADIVIHSATKYLGGHSDVLGGALIDVLGGALIVAHQDLYDRLYFLQNATGAVLSPFDCFLVSRGLKTLELRVRELRVNGVELLLRGPGREYILPGIRQGTHDLDKLVRGLAGTEYHLRKTTPQMTMMVQTGEPKVLERQMTQLLDG